MRKIKAILTFVFIFLMKAEAAYAVEIFNPAPGFLISYNDNSFTGLLTRIIQLILGVVGIVTMTFIIIGGFQYITSRGDDEQATAGKKTLSNAIIGLVIVILSYVIVTVIINALKPKGGV
ncbi:MAG: pilin [Candidatus Doudnabacteria bacterium]|nr:pilin [Candidatus Doudnabacteria bacterium]